jgi:hypothetical protein
MHIAVELEETTLRQLLGELLPITILFDEAQGLDGRWIRIDPAHDLQLRVDDGIRLVTSGAVRWHLGPIPVTVTVRRLALMLRPLVVGTGMAGRVLFRPVIETADLHNLPKLLDRTVVGLVNRALEARSKQLVWNFGQALALRFTLPNVLSPLEAAAVSVETARVRVRADALELTVSLTMHIDRLAGDLAAGRRVDVA